MGTIEKPINQEKNIDNHSNLWEEKKNEIFKQINEEILPEKTDDIGNIMIIFNNIKNCMIRKLNRLKMAQTDYNKYIIEYLKYAIKETKLEIYNNCLKIATENRSAEIVIKLSEIATKQIEKRKEESSIELMNKYIIENINKILEKLDPSDLDYEIYKKLKNIYENVNKEKVIKLGEKEVNLSEELKGFNYCNSRDELTFLVKRLESKKTTKEEDFITIKEIKNMAINGYTNETIENYLKSFSLIDNTKINEKIKKINEILETSDIIENNLQIINKVFGIKIKNNYTKENIANEIIKEIDTLITRIHKIPEKAYFEKPEKIENLIKFLDKLIKLQLNDGIKNKINNEKKELINKLNPILTVKGKEIIK